jgi:hypothetical protein
MLNSRRTLLRTFTGTVALLVSQPLMGAAMQRTPQPMPSPHAPDQNAPAGMDGPDIIKPPKDPTNTVNNQAIVASVQQLYKLASELKDEADQVNLHGALSVSFVKKAQQIEKLAKQIKDRAKG